MAAARRTLAIDTSTVTGPAAWASALVNGDDSGLDADDELYLKRWVENLGKDGWYVVATVEDQEPRFTNRFDLYSGGMKQNGHLITGGDVVDYIVHRQKMVRSRGRSRNMAGASGKSIYQRLVEAGVQIDHHETDLYVPVNPTTTKILEGYEFRKNVTVFKDAIENKRWYDIPFAYDPGWKNRAGGGARRTRVRAHRRRGGIHVRAHGRTLNGAGGTRMSREQKRIREDILMGMGRAAHVTHWANEEEEKGRTYPGQDLMDVAPRRTTMASSKWAVKVGHEIERLNGKSLPELYEIAERANAEGGGGQTTQDPKTFGHYLGMQAMGHGVAWDDDIAGGHDLIKVPYSEFYG